jgi:two-component system phosphate regulon response regulator PhoB
MTDSPKILLVEDDHALAAVYLTRIEAEGFKVKHCDNGESALSSALEYRPDLILLDVMMPKISGFDVLDILRHTPETAHTRIMILSALGQDSDIERAKALGVDEYLIKSQATISEVMSHVRRLLGMPAAPAVPRPQSAP